MATTVQSLITGSYYKAQVVAREMGTVSGSQISEGFQWLNDVISDTDVNFSMVPYETTFAFPAVIGQERYFIPGLIQIDTLTFTLNNVRYSMQYQDRNQYFGAARTNNILTLPYSWYVERELGGASLYIYFLPDQEYDMEVHGIFRLPQVTSLTQDMDLTYDRFFKSYLSYALPDRICSEYSIATPVNVTKTLNQYIAYINQKSRNLDLSMQKQSTLAKSSYINYGQVNLGKGFTVG